MATFLSWSIMPFASELQAPAYPQGEDLIWLIPQAPLKIQCLFYA